MDAIEYIAYLHMTYYMEMYSVRIHFTMYIFFFVTPNHILSS